jgi:hypothetical protein
MAAQSGTNSSIPTSKADQSFATVLISQAAREAMAASKSSPESNAVEARLAEIKAKGAVNRTEEDRDFLFANDKRLAEITAQGKSADKLTADELDYIQKTGFVNTFANLSPAEKVLYDKAVASGNTEAAAGIGQIALIRMMGHTAGGANGTTCDPLNTEITPANIEKYFSHSIVDPSGKAQSNFQALIQFMQSDKATAHS